MNGKHTILIEINGEACSGFAYQTQGGILIHLPSIQALHAPAFETLFQPLPEERLNGGFIEVGEWDGSAFPFEGDVLFGLGPDGAVWAKICDSPEELPLAINESANPSTTLRLRSGEGTQSRLSLWPGACWLRRKKPSEQKAWPASGRPKSINLLPAPS